MSNFYRAFEDRHRGPRDLIKERLQFYAPFLDAIKAVDSAANAIDLGCGRGEWLETLRDLGLQARGIDLDAGMLESCREAGLAVEQGDALEHLNALPDASHAIVSAFHLVEHLSFEQVRRLIDEALRVLKPGGLLILETPNPENLGVGTSNFYLDPTHDRPLPPQLLEFAAEFAGFRHAKIVRLQESSRLYNDAVKLVDVLTGVSPDYAVIAQKGGLEENDQLETLFSSWYGLTLDNLATRYDAQLEQRWVKLESETHAAQSAARQLAERMTAELARLDSQQHELTERILHNQEHLDAIYASTSWRITAPLRLVSSAAQAAMARIKAMPRACAAHLLLYVGRRPHIRAVAGRVLGRVPGYRMVVSKLHRMARPPSSPPPGVRRSFAHRGQAVAFARMTPRARRIYEALKTAQDRGGQ